MQHKVNITNNREVVEALIRGDETTFATVYKSYFTSLKSYASSIVMDQEAAYEIVQELFVALWENRKKLDREKSLRNYLLRATHNNSLRYLRRDALHQRHHERIKQETNEMEESLTGEEISDPESRVTALLEELPERSRQVVIMHYLENKKSGEIAEQLKISVRTVETILYQSMKKLRGKVKK